MKSALPSETTPTAAAGYRAARGTAWVAWIFLAVVASLMLVDYGRRIGADSPRSFVRMLVGLEPRVVAADPLDSSEYLDLKARLAANPSDESLKEQIRRLDATLRDDYFRRLSFVAFGGFLLVAGVTVLLVAEKTAGVLRRRLPMPAPADDPGRQRRQLAVARWSRVGVVGVAVLVALLGAAAARDITTGLPNAEQLAAMRPQVEPATPGEAATTATEATAAQGADYPTDEEVAKYWASFRGPHGAAISAYTNVPTRWDAASGENVLWKTPVPLPGNNSPIVWGDRVFVSGADRNKREVYCFDANDGKLLWTAEAPSTPQSRAKVPTVDKATGYAAPTMTTDGRRAFAMFANGDIVAVDFEGKVVWSKSLGIPENTYGHAASLAMWRDRVLVQFDQGHGDENLSKIYAFESATGKVVWEVPRPVANSWSSPIVVEHEGQSQVITASDPWIIAYDPADGKELWRAEGLLSDQGITPVVSNGLLQVGNEYCEWLAVKIDGGGNVTDTHVVWRGDDGLPDTVSPLVAGDLLLLTTSIGYVTCYDAAAGEVLWEEEIDSEFTSSPTLVGDHVYMFGKKGKSWVGKPTRDGWETIDEADLGEECVTSPAMQDGRFYIRGEKHLFCIGQADDNGNE